MNKEEDIRYALAEDLRRMGVMDPEPEEDDDDTEEPMTWGEVYEQFDDFINEMEDASRRPVVTILGYDYDPSRVFWDTDPRAYRQEFLVWADYEGIDISKLIGYDKDGD